MDFKQACKVAVELLEKREQELAQIRDVLVSRDQQITNREKELNSALKQLDDERKTIEDIKDVKAQRDLNLQRAQELTDKDVTLKKKENDLKKYENQLFEIKTNQDVKDKQLSDREQELARREQEYKQQVEKAFAENLARNLLNK